MAGDWLKLESATPEKTEVLAITAAMGWDDPDLTVGKLFRVWRWFDQHTVDGNAPGVTVALLDRICGASGFASNMESVGWLIVTDGGITLPNFDRHNGKTAKARALTARRVNNLRSGEDDCNADNVTSPLPREEKKREEEKKEDQKSNGADGDGEPAKVKAAPADLTDAAFAYNARAKSLRLPVIREARISSLTDKYRAACRKIRENIPEFTLVECVNRLLDQRERGSPFFREARFLDFEWLLKREHNGTQMNAEKVWHGKYSNADVGSGRDQRNGTTGEPVKPRRTAADFGAREWSDVRAELDKQKLPPLPS